MRAWGGPSPASCLISAILPVALAAAIPYNGAIGSIAVDAHDARNVVVASIAGGAFASRDGGRTFAHVDSLGSDRVEALAVLSSRRAIATSAQAFEAAGSGGLWIRNGAMGAVWSRTTAVFPAGCPARASAWGVALTASRTYVATDCGIAVGSSSAGSWKARSIVGGSPPYMSVAVLSNRQLVVGGPNGFWYSRDGGSTFSREATGIGGVTGIRALAADPRGGGRAYAMTDAKQLFATRDGGATWQRLAIESTSFSCGGDAFVKAVREGSQIALYAGNRCIVQVTRFGVRDEAAAAPRWESLECDHADARDMAFRPSSERPYLLSTDGGLYESADGSSFHLIAGAGAGLNALQVTEVHGQYVGNATSPDLYVATQDNKLWGLRDGMPIGSLAWEGFFMSLARNVANAADATITYAVCGGCQNGVAERFLLGDRNWHDVQLHQRAPAYVARNAYLQQTGAFTSGAGLAWSDDRGTTWRRVAGIAQPFHGEPFVAGNPRDPMAVQPIQVGTSPDGMQTVQLVDVLHLNAAQATLRYPYMEGFGSLGVTPAGFAWYEVLGIDPADPAHRIAPDASDGDVKTTFDGGDRWQAIAGLRALVSHRGRYLMGVRESDRIATLVSVVSFCPDDPSHVLIGTRAGGAYLSLDGGRSWRAIRDSEPIVYATSAFWLDRCAGAWISTYARGVWSLLLPPSAGAASAVAPQPLSTVRPLLPHRDGPSIDITSGTIEEGERVLDPHDPLSVSVTHVPSLGRFVLAVDGRAIADVAAGLPLLTYSSTPPFWPVGHHDVALVDTSQPTSVTVWTTDFIVP
ncbi:MAG: hypothetical protein JO199_11975 [Candidatus Eremiobacteraeota bacterium]|nr:hypothetical protein [Candidatus Eremiobacteraeota bacterium]